MLRNCVFVVLQNGIAVRADRGYIRSAVYIVISFQITLFQRRHGDRACEFSVFVRCLHHKFADTVDLRMIEFRRVTDGVTEVPGAEEDHVDPRQFADLIQL